MQIPEYLQKGDAMAIVSTARKLTLAELQPALKLLESWGLHYLLGKTIGAEDHQFAGNDALRANDFQSMLDNPNIKAIWCARGGHGTVRIIDALDFSRLKKHPKWIIGYSDITVLHSHIHKLGIETIHALMPLEVSRNAQISIDSLWTILFGKKYSIQETVSNQLNRKGKATGQLVGGNLSMLYSLCGSPSAIKTEGKILFIEDVDEYLYHIDRMLQNLKRNGMLASLAGLLVGGMSDMNDNTIPFGKTANQIIAEAIADYSYPVCFNFSAGHIKKITR